MFFVRPLDIPANTSKEHPIRATMHITQGVITRGWIRWRWGSGNLCGVRVLYTEQCLWPRNLGVWIPSSEHPLQFPEEFKIDDAPHELVIEAYNLDDTYLHNVWIGLTVMRSRDIGVPTFYLVPDYDGWGNG